MKYILCLLLTLLCGCSFSGAVGIAQQIPGAVSQLDGTINAVILQKAADLHNLKVGLDRIEGTPGMVVVPPPVPPTPSPVGPVVVVNPPPISPPIPVPVQ